MLRQLWRSRRLVAIVGVFALVVSVALTCKLSLPPKPKSYTVGIATTKVLLDTPRSQVVEVAPKGSDMLGSRASVLANLMVDGAIQADIAKRMGLPAKKLLTSTQGAPGTDTAPSLGPSSYALTTGVLTDSDLTQLPIIKIQAQAPDVAKAAKLADASVSALTDYLDAKAATETVPAGRRLRVDGLGPPEIELAHRGHGMLLGVAVALLLFVSGCGAILMISALMTAWRTAQARERAEGDRALENDFADLPDFMDDVAPAEPLRRDRAGSRARL